MKFVYKNEKGLVVLNEKVGILELASIDDLRKERTVITEKLAKYESNYKKLDPGYKSNRTFLNELGIAVGDRLALKEDIYYWDTDVNEFLSIESTQYFDEPSTWTEDEKEAFIGILLMWIAVKDHSYDLYEYLREINTNEEYAAMEKDSATEKLGRLFVGSLEDDGKRYEAAYIKQKAQLMFEKKNKEVSGGLSKELREEMIKNFKVEDMFKGINSSPLVDIKPSPIPVFKK